mgnify:CR=1 FL=1
MATKKKVQPKKAASAKSGAKKAAKKSSRESLVKRSIILQ